jgi:hypothetical protein
MLSGHIAAILAQLGERNDIDPDRCGLLGVGLWADVVLQATAALSTGTDSRVRATVAVSPVAAAAPRPGETKPGLDWLHELTYLQAWSWRRRGRVIQQVAAGLGKSEPAPAVAPYSAVVLLGQQAIDPTAPHQWPDLETRTIPSTRYFTLLEVDEARQFAVQHFQKRLRLDGGSHRD